MKLHYKKGAALYENKDYEGAMEEFVKARFYGPGWELGVNIAKCLEKLERYGEAATALALALEEGEGKIPGDLRTGLEKRLSSLGKKVVVLSISGGLQEHEDLYINGQVTAGVTGSGNIYLDVGQYDVEVRVGEQVLVSKKVDLKEPGGREVLDFERGKEIVIDTGKKKSSGGLKKRWTLWTGLALLLAGHGLNIGGVVQSSQTKSYSQDLEHARLMTTPDHDVCDCHKEDADMDACFGTSYRPSAEEMDEVQDICGRESGLVNSQIALFVLGGALLITGFTLLMVDAHRTMKKRKKKKKKGHGSKIAD